MDLKFFLEDLLASPIDLVTPAAIRPAMRERVKSEAVYVA
jgi:predicted nucleotidyltransferase